MISGIIVKMIKSAKMQENITMRRKISHIESNMELKIIVELDKEIKDIVITLLISKSWRK